MYELQLERIANALETIATHLTGDTPDTPDTHGTHDTIEAETKEITIVDIKNKLIEINRNDDTAKPKLKALLGAFDAVRASDLKENQFSLFMSKLEDGGY